MQNKNCLNLQQDSRLQQKLVPYQLFFFCRQIRPKKFGGEWSGLGVTFGRGCPAESDRRKARYSKLVVALGREYSVWHKIYRAILSTLYSPGSSPFVPSNGGWCAGWFAGTSSSLRLFAMQPVLWYPLEFACWKQRHPRALLAALSLYSYMQRTRPQLRGSNNQ